MFRKAPVFILLVGVVELWQNAAGVLLRGDDAKESSSELEPENITLEVNTLLQRISANKFYI